MKKSDGRKRTPIAQRKARKLVIDLRNEGVPNQEVAKRAGISVSHASKIWQRYKKEGKRAIRRRKRGRQLGEQRTLLPTHEQQVQSRLTGGFPKRSSVPPWMYETDQAHVIRGFPGESSTLFWTQEAVKRLIRKISKVEMPMRTVREYLKRWGFTPQKPVKIVSEHNSQAMNRWLETEYPVLVARAKEEKAEIHWVSKHELQTNARGARRSATTGRSELVPLPFKKISATMAMVSSITNQGKVRFVICRGIPLPYGSFLIMFMQRLLEETDRKIFILLDNLLSYHEKNVDNFLGRNKEDLEVFHLPSNLKDSPQAS